LSYLLAFSFLRDLLFLVLHISIEDKWIFTATAISLIVGSAIAFNGPFVKIKQLSYSNIPKGLNGLRIAQISDLHISFWIGESYVSRTVKKVNDLKPDIIVLTGDLVDGHVDHIRKKFELLKNLKSTYGVYFVPGNHEYYWRVFEWIKAFQELGFRYLENENVSINHNGSPITLAGIPDPAVLQVGEGPKIDIQKSAQGIPSDHFKIFLSHRPEFAQEASKLGFDLQFSGHTHGGQFFPWTFVVRLAHRYSLGKYKIGKMQLYVSAGTGSWGPMNRLGTLPEVSLVVIKTI
jgi:predicted MPP superfamily phosphohydrolase